MFEGFLNVWILDIFGLFFQFKNSYISKKFYDINVDKIYE